MLLSCAPSPLSVFATKLSLNPAYVREVLIAGGGNSMLPQLLAVAHVFTGTAQAGYRLWSPFPVFPILTQLVTAWEKDF